MLYPTEMWFLVLIVAITCFINLDAIAENKEVIIDGKVDDNREIYDSGLFEGDIRISFETIRQFYDLNEKQEMELMAKFGDNSSKSLSHVGKRAAVRSKLQLWPEGKVYYTIDPILESRGASGPIREAMDIWERSTCLQFIPRTTECAYIKFTDDGSGCNSYVGRQGGKQNVNLSPGCVTQGIILHEIGHAMGLWHEHSRPDRDSYITVLTENVQHNRRYNYNIKRREETNSRGTEYDYNSIMHYTNTAWVNYTSCRSLDCVTFVVNNYLAYVRQGTPPMNKFKTQLSSIDIEQMNRLYSCHSVGEHGVLMVNINYGVNLENRDSALTLTIQPHPDCISCYGNSDPYVEVTASSYIGSEYKQKTMTLVDTQNPTWNESLFFSDSQWRFFEINVCDYDSINQLEICDPLSQTETVPLLNQARNSTDRVHCANPACDRFIVFDYRLLTPVHVFLWVSVRYAVNLPNTDQDSDPNAFVNVTAILPNLSQHSKTTEVIQSNNPVWNQWLGWWECDLVAFEVQIFDNTLPQKKELSDKEIIYMFPGYHSSIKVCISSSCDVFLLLDYVVDPDGNECCPNPCLNGGTCYDGCSSYSCYCVSPYTGTNCEHWNGHLTFSAHYGSNLPDLDLGSGLCDPFIEFIAYDANGHSRVENTSIIYNNSNPTWEENIDFGFSAWKNFSVMVWDKDTDTHDVLSSGKEVSLFPMSSGTFILNANDGGDGYVIFSYSYE